jgi:hypothetical protein
MGRDPALTSRHPSVILNGNQYYYGRQPDPRYDYYLFEHADYGKDYWWFKEKEDLVAFLVNLPESADRDRHLKLHPDWRDVTHEQREAYGEEDRAALRALAQEKLNAGTAQSFNLDLDGKEGPHAPQQIRANDQEPPLDRVERQLSDHKTYRMHGLSDAGKLRMIEGEIDWSGVAAKDKEAILAREVNFSRITPEQFKFVYEDIAFEKVEPADRAVAQALFDHSRAQGRTKDLRPATKNLVKAVVLDVWPNHAAVIDFGIDSQSHYEALYYPLRHGDITAGQLEAALGDGKKLTELVNGAEHNPHRGIVFRTSWDELKLHPGAEPPERPLPSPGDIADGLGGPESPGHGPDRGPEKRRSR